MSAQWTTDTVTQHTQELLRQLGPLLVSLGPERSAGELLLYLEELDLISEGCGVLAALQAVAEAELGALIRREVQALPPLGPTSRALCQQLGGQLLQRLSSQPAVQQLRARLNQVTEAAAREMLENADELRDVLAEPAAVTRDLPVEGALSRSVGSSLYGSLNPSLVFSPADLDGLGAALGPEQDEQTRADSLALLLTALAGGSVSAELWTQLRPAVQDALLDTSDAVAGRAHQVHSRMLVCDSHFFIKEAYLSLLETVCTIYVDRRRRAGAAHRGLNVGLTETKRALQILAMVNQYQRYVTRAWLRFPDRHVEEMVENTVDLLTLGVPRGGVSSMTDVYTLPVALLCLLDPAAAWFQHWMHTEWSRQKMMAVLRKSPQLLQLMLSTVQLHGRAAGRDPATARARPGGLLVAESVAEACYSHAVHVLVCVTQYRCCRALFPITARRDGVGTSLPELVLLLLDEACQAGGQLALSALSAALRHAPPLQEACGEPALLSALAEQLQRALSGRPPARCPAVLRLLLVLTESAAGQRHLAAGRRSGSTHRGSAGLLARAICQAAPRALQAEPAGRETAAACAALLANLCRSHLGLQTLLLSDLLQTLNERLRLRDPNLEHSSRMLTGLSEHVMPLCGQLARYPRALCVLLREQLLSPTLKQLGAAVSAEDGGWRAPLEGLPCLRRCASLLPLQAWCQRLLAAAAASLDSAELGFLMEEDQLPHLRHAHLLSCWAASHWGTWMLTRSSPRPLLPCDLTSVVSGPCPPAWVCLVAMMCCTHLDGRTTLICLTKAEGASDKQEADQSEVIDEAYVLRQQSRAMLGSVDFPTDTLIHQYLGPECARPKPAAAGRDTRRVMAVPRRSHELSRFLAESRHSLHDAAWLSACRKALKATLTTAANQSVRESQLTELLDQLLEVEPPAGEAALSLPERCIQPAVSTLTEDDLTFAKDAAAADLVLQYGSSHRLVTNSAQACEAVLAVLRHGRRLCGEISSDTGVHWFAAVSFLIYGGNLERCRYFLTSYFSLAGSAFVWTARGNHVCRCRDLSTDELLLSGLMHHVGALVEQELPGVHIALQSGRVPLTAVCEPWLRQCYLGVLPWPEVCHYVAITTCLGPDYVLYFTVAVLRHLQTVLLQAADRPLPLLTIKLCPIQGYQSREHLSYMETLCRRYRRSVLSDLNACLNQNKWAYEV